MFSCDGKEADPLYWDHTVVDGYRFETHANTVIPTNYKLNSIHLSSIPIGNATSSKDTIHVELL